MNENDTIKRAKFYIEKLSNGINPINNKTISEGDIINHPKVSNCLAYVSDLLGDIADNKLKPQKNPQKKLKERQPRQNFTFTEDDTENFNFSDYPITITEFTKRINAVIRGRNMRRLRRNFFTNILVHCNLLCYELDDDGMNTARPTEKGKSIGISTQTRTFEGKDYTVVLYNIEAQKYILENVKLENI